MTMDQCEWRNSCNRQSYGGEPRCRSHSDGGSSCCVVFVPQCSHCWCCGRRCWPSPAGPAVPRPWQLAVLRAMLLAQAEQQPPQGVSYRRDACCHVFAGSVAGHLPYQRRTCTWRRSNAGMCSPGGRIWMLTISNIKNSVLCFHDQLLDDDDRIWYDMMWYDMMIYLFAAIELTPGGSSTVHIYTQTIHRTSKWNNTQKRTYITIRIHKHKNKNA
jgi:hypothetical protein